MWLITEWKLVLIVSGIFALVLTTSAWQSAKKDLIAEQVRIGVMQAQWAAQVQVSETAKNRFATTIREINRDHNKLLEQAKVAAIANFVRAGFRAARLPNMPTGSSTATADVANSAEGLDATTRRLLADCAADVTAITEWQQWARMNKLPVED